MAFENVLTRLIAQIAKHEATKEILSEYGPPSRGDILHDGVVGAGETWGGILGSTAGITGGEALGGPPGAIAGGFGLGSTGALAGGWAAHGAYRAGEMVRDFLSHLENSTVGATGATTPATDSPALSPSIRVVSSPYRDPLGSIVAGSKSAADDFSPQQRPQPVQKLQGARAPSVFDTGTSPAMLPSPAANEPRGLPGLMADAGLFDSSNPDQPPPGGLLGLIQGYMRNSAAGGAAR